MDAKNQQQLTIIASIVVVAVVAAGIFVFLSRSDATGGSINDYSEIVQERTSDGGYILGDPNAPITIVEFADFLCPHCQDYKSTVDRIIEELVVTGQARFEYRMFPVTNPALSTFVGQVAECAGDLHDGGFWPVHDELFRIASSSRVTQDIGQQIAEEFGIEYGELLTCTQDAEQVMTDERLASRLGIRGTPAVRIRYGDSQPQVIGPAYERGGAPFDVLQAVVAAAQQQ